MATIGLQAMIDQAAKSAGVPSSLLAALVHQESGGNPNAVSPSGAMGLTQLMPSTAESLGVSNPRDPMQNLLGGAKYLAQQLKTFGSVPLALAAYNAGPGAVQKYGGVPPYAETQAYVKNIMAMAGHVGAGSLPTVPSQSGPAPQTAQASPSQGPSLGDLIQPPGAEQGMTPDQQLMQPDQALSAVGGNIDTNALLQQVTNSPIPMPIPQTQSSSQASGQQQIQLPDPTQQPHIPITGLNGDAQMVTGGVNNKYPNLQFSAHADWHHVNPALLEALQKIAEQRNLNVSVISGYRSNQYSQANGGFANDPHTKGLAVDAYINGHPIGEVIPPQEWAKLGIRSGAVKGFYKGKSDPEHLDLVGMPIKGGRR